MEKHKQQVVWLLFGFLCIFFLLGLSACPSPERFEGTYVAVENGSSPHGDETIIELKENSQGVCRTDEQEVPFRWSVRNREIRLHTKEGGIIVGEITSDTLTLTLPGEKKMTFKKSASTDTV